MTCFDDEKEDNLRKALYVLFDLSPLELLVFQGIMRNKTLNEIGLELTQLIANQNKLIQKNPNKRVTRHHIFQLRKSMLKKLGERFAPALLTQGQKKELKKN